ncbi:ATP-dependent Clp protease ATP-binding subunit, partial [bacterium]|nr:ATP-dependent Clp protease ATP-binding subunit [bacterium]
MLQKADELLISDAPDTPRTGDVPLSEETQNVVRGAIELAVLQESDTVESYHLAVSIARRGGETVREFLTGTGIEPDSFADTLMLKPEVWRAQQESILTTIGEDWTEMAVEGRIAPRVGRDRDVDHLIEILLHKEKRGPLLIGPPGVGKSTIIEQLALRLAAGEVPERLRGLRLVHIHPDRMFAGITDLPSFAARIKELENQTADGNTLLFLDDIHRYVTDESGNFNAALANVVKSLLVHPELTVIAATQTVQYYNYVESDPALGRRFTLVRITEPDEQTVLLMMENTAVELEAHHGVKITRAALEGSIRLAGTYLRQRRFPDAVVDVLDHACARTYLARGSAEHKPQVRLAQVEETIAEMTGIHSPGITADFREKFRRLEEFLHERVIGQKEAVRRISGVIRYAKSKFDLHASRPDGVFLFIGPAGSGKTKIAKSISQFFFGDEKALIDFRLGQLDREHELLQIAGNEGPTLVNFIRHQPNGVVMLDNIDQAHPETREWIRKIISQGWNVDNSGNRVHFSNTTIIMTALRGPFVEKDAALGYAKTGDFLTDPTKVRIELEKVLGADFLNHIDEIVFFRRLTEDDCFNILKEKLLPQAQKLLRGQRIHLDITDRALRYIAREGYSTTFGASYLKNTFQRLVLIPTATKVIESATGRLSHIRVTLRADTLV